MISKYKHHQYIELTENFRAISNLTYGKVKIKKYVFKVQKHIHTYIHTHALKHTQTHYISITCYLYDAENKMLYSQTKYDYLRY